MEHLIPADGQILRHTVLTVQVRNTKDIELAAQWGAKSTADAGLAGNKLGLVPLGDCGSGGEGEKGSDDDGELHVCGLVVGRLFWKD